MNKPKFIGIVNGWQCKLRFIEFLCMEKIVVGESRLKYVFCFSVNSEGKVGQNLFIF